MIPEQRLSTRPILGSYIFPYNQEIWDQQDWEMGGLALSDTSLGNNYQVWRSEYTGSEIILHPQLTGEPVSILTKEGIVQHSFSFDQSMRWTIVYTLNTGVVEHIWYDAAIEGYATTMYSNKSWFPKLLRDDVRQAQLADSDVILTYVRNGALFFKAQRDRFEIEYLLVQGSEPSTKLIEAGMNNRWRLQFKFDKVFTSAAVAPTPVSLMILTTSIGPGVVGQEYSYPLTAISTAGDVVWSVANGMLPLGLQVEDNVIVGTPTVNGRFRSTLKVVDSVGNSEAYNYWVTVNLAP